MNSTSQVMNTNLHELLVIRYACASDIQINNF